MTTSFWIRTAALALIATTPTMPAHAQDPSAPALAAQTAAIAKLAWMDGTWRGIAVTKGPEGSHEVTQTERIGNLLGGSIKLLEGKAFRADGSVGFNAFGIISFDAATGKYALHSYAQGRVGTFALTLNATGYIWEIPMGPTMMIRYTATLKDGVWNEVGDRIVAGSAPQRFFEMNLKRVGDSAWPTAGGPGPK